MPLSSKQQAFVREYTTDWNATQAAIRAGYSENSAKQQGSRLLTNADVQRAIAEAQQAANERTEIDQDWVREKLVEVVRRAMPEANPDMTTAEVIELIQGSDLAAANAALDKLGRHVGLFEKDNRQRAMTLQFNAILPPSPEAYFEGQRRIIDARRSGLPDLADTGAGLD